MERFLLKASVYYETGTPDVFRYEDVPAPQCDPHGILIDVEVVSIEGGDVLARARGEMATIPHVVGYQAAGRIREVGSEVRGREVGQRVVTLSSFGSHAAVRAVPAAASWVVPDGLDIDAAACVPIPFGTADDCLFEFGRLKAGERLLVLGGAGGVGLALVQLAKRAGATVFAAASRDSKLARLAQYGVDEGINYAEQDLVEEVMRLTGGLGVDLVVDPVGGEMLRKSIAATGYRGRVITVGNASGGTRSIDFDELLLGSKSLTGVYLGAELERSARASDRIASHLRDVAGGELRVAIDSSFPLADAASAHRRVESREAFGRVLLKP